jgi:hypothetical protein
MTLAEELMGITPQVTSRGRVVIHHEPEEQPQETEEKARQRAWRLANPEKVRAAQDRHNALRRARSKLLRALKHAQSR